MSAMRVNWFEKMVVNNFVWALIQRKVVAPVWSKSMKLPAGAVVLEVGCGRGAGAVIIVEEFNPARVDAFDLDEDMIAKAAGYIHDAYKGRINLWVGDVMAIKAAEGTYDAVFDFFNLHHVEDWRRGLSEISRVLKPGGYFAFGELYGSALSSRLIRPMLSHPAEGRFEREDWIKALAENGLRMMEHRRNISNYGLMGVARKPP